MRLLSSRPPSALLIGIILLAATPPVGAAKVTFGPADLLKIAARDKTAVVLVDDDKSASRQALEGAGKFHLETYGLQRTLQPGWHKLTLSVRVSSTPLPSDVLTFAFWNPVKAGNPDTFKYETTFAAREFSAPGAFGVLTRAFLVGPGVGNYGLSLSGYKGLRVESLTVESVERKLSLEQVRADKLLYGLKETGKVSVSVLNAAGSAQTGHLTVTVESGLDDNAVLFDRDVTVAAGTAGKASVIDVPLPPQSEYGHAVVATLRNGAEIVGTARDYFYTSDRPAQVGHLGAMGFDAAYGVGAAAKAVETFRRHCFPLYEIIFWAPDDTVMLLPPPGKDRWWSGQTLARVTTDSLKDRIRLGQSQGMKALAYTNFRYDFGFRVAETFRKHPEFCDWDANNPDLAFGVEATRRQAREDDAERFDPAAPNKPKFKAEGVWRMASGNPEVLDFHIDQLVRSTQFFGWDGWRYDDRYDYDAPTIDMLGRRMPPGGLRNPAMLARLRGALEKVKPGLIYGHNLEWAQDHPAAAQMPMPADTPPHANDYYTEFLRDGGLHLQERWMAYVVRDHHPWVDVRDYLATLGHNAARRGGHAYAISPVSSLKPIDARHLAALHLAGRTHLAYAVREENVGQMRLACRHADLLYGDNLVSVSDAEKVLKVDAGGKPVWWQRTARYREVAPGKRIYLVHLINPPRAAKVGDGDGSPPEPLVNVGLEWKLPAGWKAVKALHLAGEGGKEIETVLTADAWARHRLDAPGRGLLRETLELREAGGVTKVTVPEVGIWSVVALDCQGPSDDKAPALQFPLPAAPPWPDLAAPTPVVDHSPGRMPTFAYGASQLDKWTRPNPAGGKRLSLETVADADASKGEAIRCATGWQMEEYRRGEVVQGGRYRVTFRVKATAPTPARAALDFAAWCPPNRKPAWRINGSVPLDGLTAAKGWQVVGKEVEFGYAWENFGFQVKGGFDGLLIDWAKVEEVRRLPDSKLLTARGLAGWPRGQALVPHDGLRVWFGDGLYAEHFKLAEALKALKGATVVEASHYVYREKRGFNGPFWKSPQDLASYDLVVLANVDLKTLPLEARDWLRGFVEAGGSLWLMGGPYGLGRGCWHECDLLEPLLPATLHNYDLRHAGVGKPLPLTAAAGGLLGGGWTEAPMTLWLHEIEPKRGAQVQLKAGDRPALVTGTYGKGKVALLALAPLGEEPADVLPWWKWAGWSKVTEQTAGWLLKRE